MSPVSEQLSLTDIPAPPQFAPLPEQEISGEVLIEKTIDTVGSSTAMRGRGIGFSASEIVSPIVTSSIPAIATMSPAVASVISVRLNPSYP